MNDADDAVVLDAIAEAYDSSCMDCASRFRTCETHTLDALRSMPDKGPLARSLGITPGDLGLEAPKQSALLTLTDAARVVASRSK